VLAVGPAIYGIPHLIGGLRYVLGSQTGLRPGSAAFARMVALWWGFYGSRRGWSYALARSDGGPRRFTEWGDRNLIELVAMPALIGAAALVGRRWHAFHYKAVALILPILCIAVWRSAIFIGAMVLAHNFVGFAYWIIGSRRGADRRLAVITLAVFAAIHAFDFRRSLGAA